MTLFDTSAAIDLAAAGSPWHPWAAAVYADRCAEGPVLVSHIVLAELHAGREVQQRWAALSELGVVLDPLDDMIAKRAGEAHGEYRRRGGERRSILADFLIGAHAAVRGVPLVTRDRDRFASYFPEITIISPEVSNV